MKLTIYDDPSLHFTIEDDGSSIDDKLQNHLTQRGTRLDETTPGMAWGYQ